MAPLIAPLAFLASKAVPIMAGTGALLGGQEAYKQSGGNIGATLLGAGTGAFGLGALPGVGKKLAGSKTAQNLLGKATESGVAGKLGQGVQKMQGVKGSPLTQQILGQQLLTNAALGGGLLAGSYLVPRLAGTIGTGASNVLGGVGTAANIVRPKGFDTTTGLPVYESGAVPGNLPTSPGLFEILDPTGAYQGNLAYRQQLGNVELEQLKNLMGYEVPVIDEIKRREMERDLAAAKVRTQLATGQALTLQGQRGAQALAQQGAADIGAAARQQYRYG